jgi:hypothetical protein
VKIANPLADAEDKFSEFLDSPGVPAAEGPESHLIPAQAPEPSGEKLPLTLEQQCLYAYFRTGSMAAVSREFGLTLYDLKKLSATSWWAEELTALRREEAAQLNVKFSKVLGSAMGQIEERLEKGNVVIVQGRARYVPLTAAELTRLVDVVFDKRQLLRGEATVIAGDNKKLASLAEKLKVLGHAPTVTFDMESHRPEGGGPGDGVADTPNAGYAGPVEDEAEGSVEEESV